MVTDTGGIDDRSFNASSWQGMQEAAATDPSKISVTYLQSSSSSDYTPNINTLIGKKCGIIVTVGFLMGDNTQTAAKANPNQKFAIVDYTYSPAISNIDALVFNTVQDGFLGGYLAAGMSKTGKVATFTNQTTGQTTTQTFISEGADVIFPVAGNVGLGAAKAVQDADAAAGSDK